MAALVLLALAIAVSPTPVLWTPFGLVPGPPAALRLLPGFDAMRAVVRFMVLAAFARASEDGRTWKQLGQERSTSPPCISYRRDHRRVTLLLKVRPSVARWIELGVPTHPDHAWIYGAGSWGVHEPRVFGTEVATGSGATDGALSR